MLFLEKEPEVVIIYNHRPPNLYWYDAAFLPLISFHLSIDLVMVIIFNVSCVSFIFRFCMNAEIVGK